MSRCLERLLSITGARLDVPRANDALQETDYKAAQWKLRSNATPSPSLLARKSDSKKVTLKERPAN